MGASEGFLGWVAYLGAANAGIPLSIIVKNYGWEVRFPTGSTNQPPKCPRIACCTLFLRHKRELSLLQIPDVDLPIGGFVVMLCRQKSLQLPE